MMQTQAWRRALLTVITAIVASGLVSCSLIHLDPVTAENRRVTPSSDAHKVVTLSEPIVWLNSPGYRASKGIRLPKGIYELEAEDAEYWYFRAPSSIEMRLLRGGQPVEGPDVSGGLALAKALFSITGAAAYIDVDSNHKMLVMKLGTEFMLMKGNKWDRSF